MGKKSAQDKKRAKREARKKKNGPKYLVNRTQRKSGIRAHNLTALATFAMLQEANRAGRELMDKTTDKHA